jgi:hypothetical protein
MRRCQPCWWPLCVVTVLVTLIHTTPPGLAQPTPSPTAAVGHPISPLHMPPAVMVESTLVPHGEVQIVPPPKGPFRFSVPGKNTVGLAWDGSKFWAAELGENRGLVHYCSNPAQSKWVPALSFVGAHLGPIAWGDRGLWVVDEEERKISLFDPTPLFGPAPQPPRVIRQIELPRDARRQPPATTGLTWDGSTLWLCTGCGLCSSFYRIHPVTGQVLESFFPNCEPRGLAYGVANGRRYLWTIGYNGPSLAPRLSRRQLTEDRVSVLTSRRLFEFVAEVDIAVPRDPTAVIVFREWLLVVDRSNGAISPFRADYGELTHAATPPVLKKRGRN